MGVFYDNTDSNINDTATTTTTNNDKNTNDNNINAKYDDNNKYYNIIYIH